MASSFLSSGFQLIKKNIYINEEGNGRKYEGVVYIFMRERERERERERDGERERVIFLPQPEIKIPFAIQSMKIICFSSPKVEAPPLSYDTLHLIPAHTDQSTAHSCETCSPVLLGSLKLI